MTIAEKLIDKFTIEQLKKSILNIQTDFLFLCGYKILNIYNPNSDSLVIKFYDGSVLNLSRHGIY